jgi:hypothetical protein
MLRRMMMKVLTNNYEVIFTEEKETARIRITKGKFINFVYSYDKVSMNDPSEDDELKLSFNYELIEAPESYEYEDEEADKAEFEETIGDILYDIIVNTDKIQEKDGTDNTKQSD